MAQTLQNPNEDTKALIEGKIINDIDMSVTGDYTPELGKCYIRNTESSNIKFEVIDFSGEQKIATFLPGDNAIAIKKVISAGSGVQTFTAIQ